MSVLTRSVNVWNGATSPSRRCTSSSAWSISSCRLAHSCGPATTHHPPRCHHSRIDNDIAFRKHAGQTPAASDTVAVCCSHGSAMEDCRTCDRRNACFACADSSRRVRCASSSARRRASAVARATCLLRFASTVARCTHRTHRPRVHSPRQQTMWS